MALTVNERLLLAESRRSGSLCKSTMLLESGVTTTVYFLGSML